MFKIYAIAFVLTVNGPIPFVQWIGSKPFPTEEQCKAALEDPALVASINRDLQSKLPPGTPIAAVHDCGPSGESLTPQGIPS